MKNKTEKNIKIFQYIGIGLTIIGSIIILLSFGMDFINFEMKGRISPFSFMAEADFTTILSLMLWISLFFPFAGSILHFVTSPGRILRNNILSWILSPISAFFGFMQMAVCIFVGLVAIFGGIGGTRGDHQFIGILLVVLSILIFGFFGMWKKPHETKTSTNRLIINDARISVLSFLYLFALLFLFREIALFGLYLINIGALVSLIGGIIEWKTEETLFVPLFDDDTKKHKQYDNEGGEYESDEYEDNNDEYESDGYEDNNDEYESDGYEDNNDEYENDHK